MFGDPGLTDCQSGFISQMQKFNAPAVVLSLVCMAAACAPNSTAPPSGAVTSSTPGSVDRTVLPIVDPSYPASSEIDARKATPPARFQVKAPAGAPNVLIVLLDDFGFGQSSAFGGAIDMPNLDRL